MTRLLATEAIVGNHQASTKGLNYGKFQQSDSDG